MVTRHHVREHSRKGHQVRDYDRGFGSQVRVFAGKYAGRLTYKQREELPDRDFAVILKDGTRKYPIENAAHARNALARVSANGSPEEKAEVCRKVHERFPMIHETHCKIHHERANGGAGHFGIFRRNDDPNR
jgi:hypothetical protein